MLPIDNNGIQSILEDISYFQNETAALTETGSYIICLNEGIQYLDRMGRKILHIPEDFTLTISNSLRFFTDKQQIKEIFKNCLKGKEYMLDISMCNFEGEAFWAKVSAKPIYNDSNIAIGIRGVFTSIDRFVKKTSEAEEQTRIIKAQNERLVHFAHIVSHNLRSHSSNLQFTLETFETLSEKEDFGMFKDYLNEISRSLNQTLRHLNAVVTVHTTSHTKTLIHFQTFLQNVLAPYKEILEDLNVTIISDFKELPQINYVESFLTSILKNLISNSVKYRDVKRPLVIEITAKVRQGKNLLVIKDNGMGIDLKRNGDKIFKMYKTFHNNTDARGVGLFVVKNQVESLGGDISVKSEPDFGSAFTVRF